MRYINELREGDMISETYFCKTKNTLKTKAGKSYYSMLLQDKTGTIDAKVWELSNGIEHFELICGDASKLKLPEVDVIVCNPPYFKTVDEQRKNDNPYRAAARHEGSLTLDRLMSVCEKSLSDHGHLFLVHRPLRLTEIFEEALKTSLRPRTMCLVYDQNKEEAVSVLLEFHKNYKGDLHVLKPIVIER